MRIIFMGTPDFARASLEKLLERHEVAAVVTRPDSPKGRGGKIRFSPVKELAVSRGIPVLQPERMNDEVFISRLFAYSPDIIVVVAYGRILPKEILTLAPRGAVNIHGSLLPKLRGAAPIQRSIINGDKTGGITSMYMAEGLDTGDMLIKASVEIGDTETYGELSGRLSQIGAEVLIKTLKGIEEGTITPVPQNDAEATYAPMINGETERIDWTRPAREIINLMRGLDPFPGAYTGYGNEIWKLYRAEIAEGEPEGRPGEIISAGKADFSVMTGDIPLRIKEMKSQGGKRMEVSAYMRGHGIKIGEVLK